MESLELVVILLFGYLIPLPRYRICTGSAIPVCPNTSPLPLVSISCLPYYLVISCMCASMFHLFRYTGNFNCHMIGMYSRKINLVLLVGG